MAARAGREERARAIQTAAWAAQREPRGDATAGGTKTVTYWLDMAIPFIGSSGHDNPA